MSASTVITDKNKQRYTVAAYHLKVLQCDLPDLKEVPSGVVHEGFKSFNDIENEEEDKRVTSAKESQADKEAFPIHDDGKVVSNEAHDELIESLLKKADDFSSKYLKAQMDLETFQEESAKREIEIRQEATKEAEAAALALAESQADQMQTEVLSQLENAASTLSEESQSFSTALVSVKEELVSAAIAIAQEVVAKELSTHANEIALSLAGSLMKEIDDKSEITLKVHAHQLDLFTRAMANNEKIKVVSDKAVSEGGVIVVGQMGTIEADIMQRFEHIKRNTLS